MMTHPNIHVRPAHLGDAPAMAVLCTELGYPCSASDMESRLRRVLTLDGHAVFVADHGVAGVIGWVHVFISHLLERDPQAEIGGLIVSVAHHGEGAGRLLMQEAEACAARHGAEGVFLRSNVVRETAHAFYHQIGYETVKTSLTLRKMFGQAGGA